jgi:hypothetical protein
MDLGEDRRCELVLHNDGMRLLSGTASCTECPWLSLGDGPPLTSKSFQVSDRAVLPLHILGGQLRAYRKPQEAIIRLESNGGSVTVVVQVVVAVKPFPEGVLAGALSPRHLAEKAQAAQAEAARLIESGAVARWYESNHWDYPVVGPTASGPAALQQLFEALGLTRPPRVEPSENTIQLKGRPGDVLEHVLAAFSQENRAAVAHGTCDQSWVRINPTIFRGRSAIMPLTIEVPNQPGETLYAQITVVANGGQRFVVPVTLAIDAKVVMPRPPASNPAPAPPRAPAPSIPVAAKFAAPPSSTRPDRPPAPSSRTAYRARTSKRRVLLPALFLLALVAGAAVRDYLVPAHQAEHPEEMLDSIPRIVIRFHDEKKDDELEKLWLTDSPPTMRFGVLMLRNGQEAGQGTNVRRLTFDPWGRTNNTCVRLDGGDERLFGSPQGTWEEREARSWLDDQGQQHEGVKSVWVCDDKKIKVTQFVELVRGSQSRLLDTCRVRYQIENLDAMFERPVGLRFLLDSFIGGNDGVPFTIPGESDLCDTMKDLPGEAKDKQIPDFLQALEKADLAHPGTVAHLRLKLDGLEVPERVTLGAWPNEKLRVLARKNADGPSTSFDVPLLPMKALDLNDSAIVIYWKEQPLKPGAKRQVGFEYGLWNLASQDSQLATTVDGAFRPDGELTVVAYVNRAGRENTDDTVTLTLPEGFKLQAGDQTQPVPKLSKNARTSNVPITWKVLAGPTGAYEFKVECSSGQTQTLRVEIRKPIF